MVKLLGMILTLALVMATCVADNALVGNENEATHASLTGKYLYLALDDEKLAHIKEEPPATLSLHVDQSGYERSATFTRGDALNKAVELLCAIQIGKKSDEWVTDNYNGIRLTWDDGSQTSISLNLHRLEVYAQSAYHTYDLIHLDAFWSYCEDYLEEDLCE